MKPSATDRLLRVRREDVERARRLFPDARIEIDPRNQLIADV